MAAPIYKITDFLGITNSKLTDPVPAAIPVYNPDAETERKVLHEWSTVTIPKTNILATPKLNRSHLIIGIFIGFLLLLMKEFMFIAALGSMAFLWYVMTGAPSEKVTHRLTNHGVDFAGQFYAWATLKEFFFKKTGTMDTVCYNIREGLPGRLFLMLEATDIEKVKEISGRYLEFLKEEPKTPFDKVFETAASTVNVEPQE